MGQLTSYSPDNYVLTFGAIIFRGFAKGTFMELELAEDTIKEDVGSSGDVVRVFTPNHLATLTVTLQGSSPTNDQLSSMHLADRITKIGYAPLQLMDRNGATLFSDPQAYIRKFPKFEAMDDANNYPWVIVMPNCADFFIGGRVL